MSEYPLNCFIRVQHRTLSLIYSRRSALIKRQNRLKVEAKTQYRHARKQGKERDEWKSACVKAEREAISKELLSVLNKPARSVILRALGAARILRSLCRQKDLPQVIGEKILGFVNLSEVSL